MNKEKMNEILGKVSKRMDLVALAVIGLLMIATVWLNLRETQYQLPQATPPDVPKWKVKLPIPKVQNEDPTRDAALIKHVENVDGKLFGPKTKITEDEASRRLIVNNMFDLKSVEEQSRTDKEMSDLFNQAQRAADQKKYDEASTMLNTILAKDPRNANALQLKKKIDDAVKGVAAPNPATPAPR